MMHRYSFLILIIIFFVASCVKPPDYPIEPRIEFVSMNANTFDELDEDSLSVVIYFEDGDGDPNRDALYDQCVSFVLETRKVSVSSLQRKFSLGYNRAARIVDQMEENGIVSAQGANGKREILV